MRFRAKRQLLAIGLGILVVEAWWSAAVAQDGAAPVENESYQPWVRFATLDFVNQTTIAIDGNIEVTGLDVRTVAINAAARCIFRIMRSAADTPKGSDRHLFIHYVSNHFVFEPDKCVSCLFEETIHYTFEPPVLLTDDIDLFLDREGGGQCVGNVLLRGRV